MCLNGKLRNEIMKKCHDSRWASYSGIHCTLVLFEYCYYWPHMGDNVESYVKTCPVCQQDKIELKILVDLL